MRGARAVWLRTLNRGCGTSPHARGKGHPQPLRTVSPRYIPACAGQGKLRPRRVDRPMVHPRMRGARPRRMVHAHGAHGTSPRARGKARGHRCYPGRQRYIPACAGQGIRRGQRVARSTVHPRVRGARIHINAYTYQKDGTSPRARGKGWSLALRASISRYIPACAGQGTARELGLPIPSVHPRVRGQGAQVAS